MATLLLLLLLHAFTLTIGWPDGAPCIRAAYESMNPLEAVEHQGGLQLTPPPFHIEIKQSCYWLNQPVELTIKGNTTKTEFKGFAMQPFVFQGPNAGQRVGQFLNVDANGSWRQQCFKSRDSATHSHDEKKKKLTMFWKNDRDEQSVVQFVATVVVSLRQFWVKSVVSAPLPPCRLQRQVSSWQPLPITSPPPVGRFKIETFRMFNQGTSDFLQNALANERSGVSSAPRTFPLVPKPAAIASFTAPPPETSSSTVSFLAQQPNVFTPALPQPDGRRLTQPIPLPNMQMNRRPVAIISNNPQFVTPRRSLVSNSTPRLLPQTGQCFDQEPGNRCLAWINFCSPSLYMQNFCRRTCRLC